MPEPETFLEPLGASGLWRCTRTHIKKGLVPHSSAGWDGGQIQLILISRIQLMGHTSADCGVSGTDLVECVTSLEPRLPGVGAGVALYSRQSAKTDISRASGGGHPPASNSPGGWGSSSCGWGDPLNGNADGVRGIFGECWVCLGYAPAPGTTIKMPCSTLARMVGHAINTIDLISL